MKYLSRKKPRFRNFTLHFFLHFIYIFFSEIYTSKEKQQKKQFSDLKFIFYNICFISTKTMFFFSNVRFLVQ